MLLLALLADENIPKKLTLFLRGRGVDIIRLQDFGARGLGGREQVDIANRLGRAILTGYHDFTIPYFLSLVKNGVIYISYQPSKTEIMELVDRIAALAKDYNPKPGLLIIIRREYIEISPAIEDGAFSCKDHLITSDQNS